MPIYLMDKTYKISTAGGVAAGRVVVAGSASGECAPPGAANAGAILGVTMHDQLTAGRSVTVRKAGIAEVVAASAISAGAPVNIHGATGKVKPITEAAGTKVNCLGFAENAAAVDGDLVEVFISIHERTA